ncbi:VOC family protein [Streptosporangium sp. NPDC048865]|uniref:VOC family protein n=1 Tax=Streptosporangium sp. NPDC048865 TaxID=3155766 RepID=UPI00343C9CD8
MTSRQERAEGLTVRAVSGTDLVLAQTFAAPRRLVFDAFTRPELLRSEVHDGWEEGEALVITVFDEQDGRTTMTTTVRYPSREARDSVLGTPMERGAGEAYDRLGFHVDVDVRPADGVRFVQLTPPGSACSITLSEGVPSLDMPAGTLRGLHLVVSDIEEARAALLERGADVGPVEDVGGVHYARFADPDGNTWTLQHTPWHV